MRDTGSTRRFTKRDGLGSVAACEIDAGLDEGTVQVAVVVADT